MFKNKRGFTLIEFIIVMAIIGVLVLMASPRFMNYIRDAKLIQIKNDTKLLEDILLAEEAKYMTKDGNISHLIGKNEAFNGINKNSKKLINEKMNGKQIDPEFIKKSINTKLREDQFYYNEDKREVFYYYPEDASIDYNEFIRDDAFNMSSFLSFTSEYLEQYIDIASEIKNKDGNYIDDINTTNVNMYFINEYKGDKYLYYIWNNGILTKWKFDKNNLEEWENIIKLKGNYKSESVENYPFTKLKEINGKINLVFLNNINWDNQVLEFKDKTYSKKDDNIKELEKNINDIIIKNINDRIKNGEINKDFAEVLDGYIKNIDIELKLSS